VGAEPEKSIWLVVKASSMDDSINNVVSFQQKENKVADKVPSQLNHWVEFFFELREEGFIDVSGSLNWYLSHHRHSCWLKSYGHR
jgi:hypothetical protein